MHFVVLFLWLIKVVRTYPLIEPFVASLETEPFLGGFYRSDFDVFKMTCYTTPVSFNSTDNIELTIIHTSIEGDLTAMMNIGPGPTCGNNVITDSGVLGENASEIITKTGCQLNCNLRNCHPFLEIYIYNDNIHEKYWANWRCTEQRNNDDKLYSRHVTFPTDYLPNAYYYNSSFVKQNGIKLDLQVISVDPVSNLTTLGCQNVFQPSQKYNTIPLKNNSFALNKISLQGEDDNVKITGDLFGRYSAKSNPLTQTDFCKGDISNRLLNCLTATQGDTLTDSKPNFSGTLIEFSRDSDYNNNPFLSSTKTMDMGFFTNKEFRISTIHPLIYFDAMVGHLNILQLGNSSFRHISLLPLQKAIIMERLLVNMEHLELISFTNITMNFQYPSIPGYTTTVVLIAKMDCVYGNRLKRITPLGCESLYNVIEVDNVTHINCHSNVSSYGYVFYTNINPRINQIQVIPRGIKQTITNAEDRQKTECITNDDGRFYLNGKTVTKNCTENDDCYDCSNFNITDTKNIDSESIDVKDTKCSQYLIPGEEMFININNHEYNVTQTNGGCCGGSRTVRYLPMDSSNTEYQHIFFRLQQECSKIKYCQIFRNVEEKVSPLKCAYNLNICNNPNYLFTVPVPTSKLFSGLIHCEALGFKSAGKNSNSYFEKQLVCDHKQFGLARPSKPFLTKFISTVGNGGEYDNMENSSYQVNCTVNELCSGTINKPVYEYQKNFQGVFYPGGLKLKDWAQRPAKHICKDGFNNTVTKFTWEILGDLLTCQYTMVCRDIGGKARCKIRQPYFCDQNYKIKLQINNGTNFF